MQEADRPLRVTGVSVLGEAAAGLARGGRTQPQLMFPVKAKGFCFSTFDTCVSVRECVCVYECMYVCMCVLCMHVCKCVWCV